VVSRLPRDIPKTDDGLFRRWGRERWCASWYIEHRAIGAANYFRNRRDHVDPSGIRAETPKQRCYPWTSTSVEHVLDSPHLSGAQKAAILGGTAATLLGIAVA
jgi:hypothetical protein